MPEPLPTDQTPTMHPSNVLGSPLTTIGGILGAVAQYLGTQGAALPHDTNSWISFGVGLAMAIAGALVKTPGK